MKKRVLIVASTMEHIENFHMPYIEGLKSAGADVFIMAKGVARSGAKPDFQVPFEKKFFSTKNLKIIEIIKQILQKNHFDVIILNTTLAAFLVRAAVKKLKTKPRVINIVHGYLFGKSTSKLKNFVMLKAERYVRKVTDDILVMNNEDYEIATKYKLAKSNIIKINGMGFNKDNRITESGVKYEKKSRYAITFVGELSKRKNQKLLLNLVKELENKGVEVKLNLIGTGAMESELKLLSEELGISSKVNFAGYDKNIQKYFDKTDFYISPSQIEGLPFNILEAMRAGSIVLSADVKGCNDIIEDNVNGFLYPFDDIEFLTNKILEIKDDEKLLNKIKINAVESVKKYEFDDVYKKNLKILTKLMMESRWK